MDVFQEYKPIRNKIAMLSVEESLAVIWAYCQYLQINDFGFPPEIEVHKDYLNMDVPQRWIAEWDLELMAKEVILNAGPVASRGRTLRTWKTLSELMNAVKSFEQRIYAAFGSPQNILVELVRMAHRQFLWQSNSPDSASIIRYYKIFNRPGIDRICKEKINLNIWETYMCGMASLGFFLTRPAIALPFKSEIKALSVELFQRFFAFTSKPLAELKTQLKSEQRYDGSFTYAYHSLRAFPLVKMSYQGQDSLVCPSMTLLYWRFTGGLYYELISIPEFGNEFGEGFQSYVGDVLTRACPAPMQCFPEREYVIGKSRKRSVDWIVADLNAAVFLECKAKRLSWDAKVSLIDLGPLEADIDSMAMAVVQVYKTIADYLDRMSTKECLQSYIVRRQHDVMALVIIPAASA